MRIWEAAVQWKESTTYIMCGQEGWIGCLITLLENDSIKSKQQFILLLISLLLLKCIKCVMHFFNYFFLINYYNNIFKTVSLQQEKVSKLLIMLKVVYISYTEHCTCWMDLSYTELFHCGNKIICIIHINPEGVDGWSGVGVGVGWVWGWLGGGGQGWWWRNLLFI